MLHGLGKERHINEEMVVELWTRKRDDRNKLVAVGGLPNFTGCQGLGPRLAMEEKFPCGHIHQ